MWPIFYKDVAEKDDRDALMRIGIHNRDNEVIVHYQDTLKRDDEIINRLACHEMLHWVLDPLDVFLLDRLSKKDFWYSRELVEQAIETITLAFTNPDRNLPTGWHERDKDVEKER